MSGYLARECLPSVLLTGFACMCTMKAYGGVEVSLHLLLTMTLGGR